MTDAALLGIPLRGAGSGRQRYAKAMELHAQGIISADMLEAYRIAAAWDGTHPGTVLVERGLPLPPSLPASRETILRNLVAEAAVYLAGLPGPGVAEVCQGIARFRHGPVTPANAPPDPVCATHLAPALAALAPTHPSLAEAIARAAPLLAWQPYAGYPPADIGTSFPRNHSACLIIGGGAPIAAQDFDLGLFLIAPHILYRDHHHPASELYAPLTGPHGWRFGPNQPLTILPAHTPVWNPPNKPHLTKVGPVPFLCIYGWTRDVDLLANVLPAQDWDELEALRLG